MRSVSALTGTVQRNPVELNPEPENVELMLKDWPEGITPKKKGVLKT